MTESIRDDILYDLERVAALHHITVVDVDRLSMETPDSSIEKSKLILMNPTYEKCSYEFRLAHELSHILFGNGCSDEVYQFSPYIKRGKELEMHKHAIDMLMDIELPTSPFTFMDFYKIPYWLFDYVKSKFIELA
ncbi:hypothetical protein FEFB_09530 [Fructobacillus sp. EFB-N1]|uniref:hypothetical protein n=1 Tax=Fructobacillus sp. EFB-N1 TaxID=1658766 RepID=UPI00064DBD6B|nr:hypothetical protein [Fructobacillus sp. EFB-N1]KMK53283.1 hypothetical protein FEFB_09530 [Fructobacillus sp. EFB-N1]